MPAAADTIDTTDAGAVAAFSQDVDVEGFDDLQATSVSSYAAGQTPGAGTTFSSRDPSHVAAPTFHSGGASPGDPAGNPGTPIGIVAPTGAIAGDVASGANVAAPLVITGDELWNFGFMEVIFPQDVERVGFWVTHGSVHLTLRDRQGNNLAAGDVEIVGNEGSFVGISRGTADISVAALIAEGAGDSFTIDDFTSGVPAPEPSAPLLLAAGGLVLAAARRRPGA